MDDRTVGLVLRALRRRRGWRQLDLAATVGCSQSLVSSVERGHIDAVQLRTLRSLFGAVAARVLLAPSWRGAELDRIVDAEHAAIVEATCRRLELAGWQALPEVTYSVYGERGSIDVLGMQPSVRAVLVCEIKSDIGGAESTGRKLDEKRRLVSTIVRDRFGWTPATVGAVLVLPESAQLRRSLAGAAAALARAFPIASRTVAAWLRRPSGSLAATWFLSGIGRGNARRVRKGSRRPEDAQSAGRHAGLSVDQADVERNDPVVPTILR